MWAVLQIYPFPPKYMKVAGEQEEEYIMLYSYLHNVFDVIVHVYYFTVCECIAHSVVYLNV